MRKILLGVIIILLLINILQFAFYNFSKPLPKDAVPNREVAIKIAEVVLGSIYDEGVLLCKPYDVNYDKFKKSWVVCGTIPEGYLGSPPKIIIRKKDGKILEIRFN